MNSSNFINCQDLHNAQHGCELLWRQLKATSCNKRHTFCSYSALYCMQYSAKFSWPFVAACLKGWTTSVAPGKFVAWHKYSQKLMFAAELIIGQPISSFASWSSLCLDQTHFPDTKSNLLCHLLSSTLARQQRFAKKVIYQLTFALGSSILQICATAMVAVWWEALHLHQPVGSTVMQ